MDDYIKKRLEQETLDAELLTEAIKKGFSLTDIAKIRDVSPSYISRLAKELGVKTPRPGHKQGVPLSDKTRQRISDSLKQKGD